MTDRDDEDLRPGNYDRPPGAPVVREVGEVPEIEPPPPRPSKFFYGLTDEISGAIKARGWRTNPKGLGWCRFCDHGTVLLDQDRKPSHVQCRDEHEGSARWRGVNDREWVEALRGVAGRAQAASGGTPQ